MPEDPVIGSKIASIEPGVTETEELMSLSYERLVPMLLGAIQSLTARVQQLESA